MTGDAAKWAESIQRLRDASPSVPTAQAMATLAESARSEWESLVICRTSMHDLLFTNFGDPYPFSAAVHVSWQDNVYEFQLSRRPAILVTADRCHAANSGLVLSAFLYQLVAEAPGKA